MDATVKRILFATQAPYIRLCDFAPALTTKHNPPKYTQNRSIRDESTFFALMLCCLASVATAQSYFCTKQDSSSSGKIIYSGEFDFSNSQIISGEFKREYDLGPDFSGSTKYNVSAKYVKQGNRFIVEGSKTVIANFHSGKNGPIGKSFDFSGRFMLSKSGSSVFVVKHNGELIEMRCF